MTQLALLISLSLAAQATAPAPKTMGTTPSACLTELRDYVARRTAALPPGPNISEMTLDELRAASQTQSFKDQRAASAEIARHRVAMAKECLAKFNAATTAGAAVVRLIELHNEAGNDSADAKTLGPLVTRGLALRSLPELDRAIVLVAAIRVGLQEPKNAARNARLETYADRLDALSDAAVEQKISAHSSMNGYYRADDIDAGIIKHSTWLIETGRTLSPAQRRKHGPTMISAYVNMAEAWAGQGMHVKAIELLERAPADWPEIPNAVRQLVSTLDRYRLIDGPAPAIAGPVWLNAPAGMTTAEMKGHVTLLEFTAWWCGPCKESYPGINRLRERFGKSGFRVLLATQLYGYFEKEGLPDRSLPADREISLDKAYFAGHRLDVPVVIGPKSSSSRDPNDLAYRVGGIPQIQIIDKQGRIRLIMVGYDDANEPKLAKFIEGLLKEK